MYKSIILPLAVNDLRKAAKWYDATRKGLGRQLSSQVRKRVRFLEKYPKSSPIRYDNTRTAVLDQFPFMIHYKVDDSIKTIIIVSIFHTSKNPNSWADRD